MTEKPILSIITPTLGNFSQYWWEQLLAIKGNVEFILVYPPQGKPSQIDEPRVKILTSIYKGETAQRAVGLLNASGKYLLALDDDDFLHPDVVRLGEDYFEHFPESLVLRLRKKTVIEQNQAKIKSEWTPLPSIETLLKTANEDEKDIHQIFRKLPIAPLDNPINFKLALFPYGKRKDMRGKHLEGFNNNIWQTEQVQEAVADFTQNMRLAELFTWLPLWGFDRVLGLFMQAKFFEKESYIGHHMPFPEQIRYIHRSYAVKTPRILFPCDALLVKRFPQYGYFWNLCFEEFYNGVKTKIKYSLSRPKSKM